MKKMRKLIPAFAMLMVAAIMMTTASFAWFSIGTNATVTGMQVSAKSDSSMIIHEDATFLGADDTVEFNDDAAKLLPVTIAADGKWKAPSSPQADVDVQTGALKDGKELVEVSGSTYYKTYTMYLASASDAMTGDLTVTFDDLAKTSYLSNALSIQVVVTTVTDATEAKQEVADNIVNVKNIGTKNTVTVTGLTVPCAYAKDAETGVLDYNTVSKNYVKVEFNVYFDGALREGADNASGAYYVRNASMDTTGIEFGAKFSFAANA